MTYVPLGIRTEYSFLDGMCRIDALVERARTLRLGALGIADLHGTYAFVPFYAAARVAGLRPLFGVAVRLMPDVDGQDSWGGEPVLLKLFARDREGLRNLLGLVSRAELEAAGGVAAVGFQDLERFAPGVLALDGGTRGPIALSLARGARAGAESTAARLRAIFGVEGFFVEVQRHGASEEARVEPFVVHVARKLNVPIVATTEVRYLEPIEADAHDVLRALGTEAEAPFALPPGSQFLRSDLEMRQLYRDLPEALENTWLVAERCQAELDLGRAVGPAWETRSGLAPMEELRRECERGACRRHGCARFEDLPVAVRDRVAHELAVIEERELASCFLIVQDVVRHAEEEGIPVGPGRGAAAGSLVAHALGITAVDPLRHGLLFERFVSRRDGTLPEFELDVAPRHRDQLVRYVLQRFGPERVAHAVSLTTLAARSVVREAGPALGLGEEEIEDLGRTLRAEGTSDLWHALETSARLKRAYQDDARVRHLFDVARRLEGLPRNPTLQPGGLVIAPGRLPDLVALYRGRSGEIAAQVTPEGARALGLLRLELVASRALGVFADGVRRLEERTGERLALETLPLDDEPTLRMLARGDSEGVPQLEGSGVRRTLQALEPERFGDLVAALCLCRPGARAGGLLERYLGRAPAPEWEVFVHERLASVLEETHGVLLYQEQVMGLAAAVAGYDLEEAEGLRHALQRRQVGELARQRARFLRGAVEQGIVLEAAERVFDALLRFPNFDFDRAHATGAALLAYGCAYLRAHAPAEYATAALETLRGQSQRARQVLADAVAHGVQLLPVDVNRSERDANVEEGAMRLGLAAVRRLGESGAERVLEERRSGGRFASLHDFCRRLPDLPLPAVEALAQVGAFAGLGLRRAQALALVEPTHAAVAAGGPAAAVTPQLELPFLVGAAAVPSVPDLEELPPERLLELEREALDVAVADPLLARRAGLWPRLGLETSASLAELADGSRVRVGGVLRKVTETRTRSGDLMAFVRLEDLHGEFEVVVFPAALSGTEHTVLAPSGVGTAIVLVEGTVEHQRESTRVVAEQLQRTIEAGSMQEIGVLDFLGRSGSRGIRTGGSLGSDAERPASPREMMPAWSPSRGGGRRMAVRARVTRGAGRGGTPRSGRRSAS